MKKTLLLIIPSLVLGAMSLSSTASAKHLVLHEKFTNTGCAPCAKFAPASDSLLNMRLGEVVAITYHGSYPDPNDKFYVATKEAMDERIGLYDVTGYPSVFLNGTQIVHSVVAIDQRINQLLTDEQRIDMKLSTEVKDGTLSVGVSSTPLQPLNNSNLRLFVAAVEEQVKMPRPVSNGQTEFNHEFRFFLTPATGYELGGMAGSEPVKFEASKAIEGFDNPDELCVVAWIQDMDTKEVYEAAYAPKSTDKTEAARVLLVEETPTAICSPHYTAKVTFRNLGNKPLESCNICVSINGKVQKTPWTGHLEYLDKTTVVTPDFTDFTFDQDAKNNVTNIYLSDLNGTEELSNSVNRNFTNSAVGENAVEISVFTDNKPEETAWELLDSDGNVLETSEPFTEKRKFYKHVFNLPADGCYRVHFTDKGGDGIIGDYGNGYYKLSQKTTDGKTKMIVQADFGGAEHNVFFRLNNATVGLDDITAYGFTYSADKRVLTLPCAGQLSVADAAGRTIISRYAQAGEFILDALTPGVYVVALHIPDSEPCFKTILVK